MSGRKPLAPLGPAARQHACTTDRRHPLAESVAALAHEPARLIGPFHVSLSVTTRALRPRGRCRPCHDHWPTATIMPRLPSPTRPKRRHGAGPGPHGRARWLPETACHRIGGLYGSPSASSTTVRVEPAAVSATARVKAAQLALTSPDDSSRMGDGPMRVLQRCRTIRTSDRTPARANGGSKRRGQVTAGSDSFYDRVRI